MTPRYQNQQTTGYFPNAPDERYEPSARSDLSDAWMVDGVRGWQEVADEYARRTGEPITATAAAQVAIRARAKLRERFPDLAQLIR